MMTLVIGGSCSGKSAYAEGLLEGFSEKFYIATMLAEDEESKDRVERHRLLRSGKNFVTVEQPRRLEEAAEKIRRYSAEGEKCSERQTAGLLECISNLVANEMFLPTEIRGEKQTAQLVLQGIQVLAQEVQELVVVSNNVFGDGIHYDEDTMAYLRSMALVNERLAERADRIVEVVVGIPVVLKEK